MQNCNKLGRPPNSAFELGSWRTILFWPHSSFWTIKECSVMLGKATQGIRIGGQFRFRPHSSFWTLKKCSVRLGKATQSLGQFRFWPHSSFWT